MTIAKTKIRRHPNRYRYRNRRHPNRYRNRRRRCYSRRIRPSRIGLLRMVLMDDKNSTPEPQEPQAPPSEPLKEDPSVEQWVPFGEKPKEKSKKK